MIRGLVILAAVASSGCMTAGIVVDALVGGAGIYQRWQQRGVDVDSNAELKALREAVDRNTAELRRLREREISIPTCPSPCEYMTR